MFPAIWMSEHEVLGAGICLALSVLIIGAFSWFERRFVKSKKG
jgi:hypothetical protein